MLFIFHLLWTQNVQEHLNVFCDLATFPVQVVSVCIDPVKVEQESLKIMLVYLGKKEPAWKTLIKYGGTSIHTRV